MQARLWKWNAATVAVAAALTSTLLAAPDDRPLSRVQYTNARGGAVQKRVELPGTVEAPKSAQVASEIEGLVVALNAREGQYVDKGAPLVELRSEHLDIDLTAKRAQHREAEARLALAEQNQTRARDLFESDVLSQQQLDDARFEYEAWRGRVDQLDAEIARIELDRERATVRAPFSGIVASEMTEVGQWVAKGATVIELVSPYQLEVRVEVPERYFGAIERGAAVTVRFESLPDHEVQGKVLSIVPRATDQARTFPMRVKVANDGNRLGAGMLASVSLPAGASRNAILVPKDALITRGSERFVYVVDDESQVQRVPVRTGVARGSWVEVEGKLTTSSRVVARGNERLQPNQRVHAEPMEYPAP